MNEETSDSTLRLRKLANRNLVPFEEFVGFQAKVAFNNRRWATNRTQFIELGRNCLKMGYFGKLVNKSI